MAILAWRVLRTLRDGHLDRDTVRARSAMAINQTELSAISQLERQHEVRQALAERQGYRCAYCEFPVQEAVYPIEHIRPKARADGVDWNAVEAPPLSVSEFFSWFDRTIASEPGHWLPDRERYWWLAWTWENLLLACPTCNTKYKLNRFPTRSGSLHLGSAGLPQPPGDERSLLLDPSTVDPLDHLRFAPDLISGGWGPVGLTEIGLWTIAVLGLNKRPGLRDKWKSHARQVESDGGFIAMRAALIQGKSAALIAAWNEPVSRLLAPYNDFLALRWCVFDHHVPDVDRDRLALHLPRPGRLSMRPPKPIWEARPEIDALPLDLQYRVRGLGERPVAPIIEDLITDLCSHAATDAATLATMLRREVQTLKRDYFRGLISGPAPRLVLDGVTGMYRQRT